MEFKKIKNEWGFLIIILVIYLIFLFANFNLFLSCLKFFFNIFKKIIPIFVFVFVLMVITNYFFTPKIVSKYFKKKGMKKWFFVVVAGILSAGPVYMWYSFLANLKNKGVNYGLISCFLYNRAIKIPLLPLMIFYFSLKYIIILNVVMIFMSVAQGIILNKLLD